MSFSNSPLITSEQLADKLSDPEIVILDASIPPVGTTKAPEHKWPDAVIANARRFDIETVFSDQQAIYPHTMVSAQYFEKACRALGINNNQHIVVYDNLGMFSSPRAWWMFKAMGFDNVSVLDGGLPYWIASGLPVEKANTNNIDKGNFSVKAVAELFVNKEQVVQALEHKLVLDARAFARFTGEVKEPRAGLRSGHMPNAKNLPYASLFSDGLMKSNVELKEIFEQLNSHSLPMVMSCGSGITACILALAATLAEYEDIAVYDGSWAEWGSLSECPVVTGT